MSWLLFLDESGHDHQQMPYEVRGGIALEDLRLWPFVQAMQRLELDCFGCQLHPYKKELKGSTLLDRKRYKFAGQAPEMEPEARRKHARAFLTKGLEKKSPTRDEFTAYGQACLEMARGTFQLLRSHGAVLFASAIPCNVKRTSNSQIEDFLRKDQVFLQERFFYFLEGKQQHGLLVMDEVEKSADRKFVRQLEAYFTRTATGRYRTAWIVPTPFFVSSDMTYPVQAADLCIYCLNWGVPASNSGNGRTETRRNRRRVRAVAQSTSICRRTEGRTPVSELGNCLRPEPVRTGTHRNQWYVKKEAMHLEPLIRAVPQPSLQQKYRFELHGCQGIRQSHHFFNGIAPRPVEQRLTPPIGLGTAYASPIHSRLVKCGILCMSRILRSSQPESA